MRRNSWKIVVVALAVLGFTAASASARECPRTLSLVASPGAPVYGAQATFEVHALEEPRGSVGVRVVYEDSIGRTRGYSWAHTRPAHASIKLPGDGRGVANVVKVYAVVTGDPRNLTCDVDVESGDALPELDRQCYAGSGIYGPPIVSDFDGPRAAVMAKVAFAARPGAGVGFQTWMTNSKGDERKVADRGWDSRDGAELMLQYCHRGDNQQWRRHPANWRVGASTVTLISDVIPANVTQAPQPSLCAWALDQLGSFVSVVDCGYENQRFSRTAASELRLHGRCVDAGSGQVGELLMLEDCSGDARQRWQMTPTGTLYGVDGLCIAVEAGSNSYGTPLRLTNCTPGAAIRWSTRDPK